MQFLFMLLNSFRQIGCNTGIKNSIVFIGHDMYTKPGFIDDMFSDTKDCFVAVLLAMTIIIKPLLLAGIFP